MPIPRDDKTRLVFFASNLSDTLDEGISNSSAQYLNHLIAEEAKYGREVKVLKIRKGWHPRRIREYARVRNQLSAALGAGSRLTVEGYKAALFCLTLASKFTRTPMNQTKFLIHDAGSKSQLRLLRFWARRLNPRAVHRLYRFALDWFIESTVLRNRPIVVVSRIEAAKVSFTSSIEVVPPSGMREPSASATDAVRTNELDVVLYADLRVAHLRQSVLDSLRALSRGSQQIPRRLVVLGRRALPSKILRLAEQSFAGGVLNLKYVADLRQTLASAGLVWLPDLVGSGVKNRTLDALRYANRLIATDVAIEGIEFDETAGDYVADYQVYKSVEELGELLH